jgi:hypothetical protein
VASRPSESVARLWNASVSAAAAESAPSGIGRITLGRKLPGKRRAGNPHAAFEVAGAGNGTMGRTEAPGYGESPGNSYSPIPNVTAPVLDPTTEGFDTMDLKDAKALLDQLA